MRDTPKDPEPDAVGVAVTLRLGTRRCLVVGDTPFAAATVRRLLQAGARVAMCAASAPSDIGSAERQELVLLGSVFRPEMAADCGLVVAATGDPDGDRQVAEGARRHGVPVHADSDPRRGCVQLAPRLAPAGVSFAVEGVDAPALLDDLSVRLASALPERYGALQEWISEWTPRVEQAVPEPAARRRIWQRLIGGGAGEALLSGRREEADAIVAEALAGGRAPEPGEVYLIGAGPGDPDLLTVRAMRLLRLADVVLYDRLVAPAILELAAPEAELVYVGKRRSHHRVPQEGINDMLVRHAEAGRRVARLKGGDPFIFGRGGEEIDRLTERGVRFEVVPGITAASGCAAYAGIPLTHRDHAQSCVFATGHRRGDGSLSIDFEGLIRPGQTIVFYMGLAGLESLAEGLLRHGMAPDTPAALVQQGTTPNQKVIAGPLSALPEMAARANLRAPTLIIVGEVVRLRERLAWFRPEEGRGGFWSA